MTQQRMIFSALALVCLVTVDGCDEPFAELPPVELPPPGKAAVPPARRKDAVGCRVSGRVLSTAWRALDGKIERAIVSAWKLPEAVRVEEAYGDGESFEIRLPPGKYRLDFSANGSRGATFGFKSQEITVAQNQDDLEVEQVDLPLSKTTALYGKPAPDLDGIIAWQDTAAISLKELRGQVVVLDFFAHYCSICHAYKPDLVKLREKYKGQGLVVLAIHDPSLKTLDDMNTKMEPVLQRVFDGKHPQLPIALDGAGGQSVFEDYGIYAVPAVVLIDQQGRIVRRYHHAGQPELESDVKSLLRARTSPNVRRDRR